LRETPAVRVLVTGNQGLIGAATEARLRRDGHDVVGFDRKKRDDILNVRALTRRMRGCDAVVHAAAVPANDAGTAEEIIAVNVTGTFNVLRAAEEIGAAVVFFSSVQALGLCEAPPAPVHLPLDDDYPARPRFTYGQTKRFAEDLFESFTERSGLTSVCLRPVSTWNDRHYEWIWRRFNEEPSRECRPFWEYGSFVDVRDVASAVSLALALPPGVHARTLLCGDDISASRPTREMVDIVLPGVEWQGGAEYDADPWRGLVDCSRANAVLGWQPQHSWADWVNARVVAP
jgi:nucleoside-diphosphate-sugar epimerase